MSVYNSEPFLTEAIDSILNQTYNNFEFLIVDDNSSDNSLKILRTYSDPRISIIENKVNLGLTKNLNNLLSIAKGEFIARMDADDVSLLHRFETQINLFVERPEIGICGTQIRSFGDVEDISIYPIVHNDIKFQLLYKNVIAHPTVMWRRELFHNNNLYYDEKFRFAQDYELWTRVVNKVEICNLNEILLNYRIHLSQIGSRNSDDQKKNSLIIKTKSLLRNGFTVNEDSALLIDCMFNGGFVKYRSAYCVKRADEFMDFIYKENLIIKYYGEGDLVEYWFSVFYGSLLYEYNWPIFQVLLNSRIRSYKRIPFLRLFRQGFKCIVNWKTTI